MEGRVGALHVRLSLPGGGGVASAVGPAIDRALREGLADALARELPSILIESEAVLVVRELTTHCILPRSDWSLDHRVIERVCGASVDAIAALLARPPEGDVRRYPDQGAYVASFIADMLDGTAWDRWYYGAFRRFRRDDQQATIRAVLEAHEAHLLRILHWLRHHGVLEALLALLGPQSVRSLAVASIRGPSGASSGRDPLPDTALRLLDALGCRTDVTESTAGTLDAYISVRPPPTHWLDRRLLTTWVEELVAQVAPRLPRKDTPACAAWRDEVQALLAGALDWLDTTWLGPRLIATGEALERGTASVTRLPAVSAEQAGLARSLADALRTSAIDVESDEDATVFVRLVAALPPDASEVARGSAFVALLEGAIGAWRSGLRAAAASGETGETEHFGKRTTPSGPHATTTDSAMPIAARASPSTRASRLAACVIEAAHSPLDAAEDTRSAGLYLLTRALLDVRLDALARENAIPWPSLRGALAIKWLELPTPFDTTAALWVGADAPPFHDLDASGGGLAGLEASLRELLVQRGVLDGPPAADAIELHAAQLTAELPCTTGTNRALARIAVLLVRAWSYWLPGLREASPAFLRERMWSRAAQARITLHAVDLVLAPAPLDVVMEMAGYLKPIEQVGWLSGRTVRFAVRREAGR